MVAIGAVPIFASRSPVLAADGEVQMNASPNPAVEDQLVKIWIDFGPYCPYGQGQMQIYAVEGLGVSPISTQQLGWFAIPAEPQRIGYLYTHALHAATWRLNGDGHCTVRTDTRDFTLHAIETILTVNPRSAARPVTGHSIPAAASPSPIAVSFKAPEWSSSHPSGSSVNLTSFHKVVAMRQTADPPAPTDFMTPSVTGVAAILGVILFAYLPRRLRHPR